MTVLRDVLDHPHDRQDLQRSLQGHEFTDAPAAWKVTAAPSLGVQKGSTDSGREGISSFGVDSRCMQSGTGPCQTPQLRSPGARKGRVRTSVVIFVFVKVRFNRVSSADLPESPENDQNPLNQHFF